MLMQSGIETASALVKFYSKEDIVKYIKSLIETYQKQLNEQGDRLGSLLRVNPAEQATKSEKPEKSQKPEKAHKVPEGKIQVLSKGWIKIGNMLFNVTDPVSGNTEVSFQIHEETKQKLARTTESLRSFEEAAGTIIPEGATYVLHVRNGVPERIIVDTQEKKRSTFDYSATFKLA